MSNGEMVYKFGTQKNDGRLRHYYGNLFKHEVYPEWSRVTIGPRAGHVSLMLEIARAWSGPYGILYVLKVSRCNHKAARYQSPSPCSFEELERFARYFESYFEGDGRHHLWFSDVNSGSQLVYDNHDLVYAYGNDEQVISLLKARGYTEGGPDIPSPHIHCYNQQFDDREDEIMDYFEWIEFPLQDEHDNP
jgi:hypothetical protein